MLYAIQCGDEGPIKIGKARRVSSRLSALQISTPIKLRLLAECNWHDQNEEIIHHHLRHSYIRGEWFDPTDEVMEVVGLMKRNDFDGLGKVVGRLFDMPKFDKKRFQREYMKAYRAVKAGRAEWIK